MREVHPACSAHLAPPARGAGGGGVETPPPATFIDSFTASERKRVGVSSTIFVRVRAENPFVYVSSYNPLLVAASLFVAILASYTALDMAGRITTAQGRAAKWWLAGGASAMGVGIWSMHFIGMLAFSLPIPLGYDPAITMLSLLIAIASSVFALWLVCQENLPWRGTARINTNCRATRMPRCITRSHSDAIPTASLNRP